MQTNLRLRGGSLGAPLASSNESVKLFPIRTAGDDPRDDLLVDMCRPATPPNILKNQKQYRISLFANKNANLHNSKVSNRIDR